MRINLQKGAAAQFGPGKFKDLYRNMILPAGKNKIFFAGEALSLRHAWVEGALDSAWRAVAEFCLINGLKDEYLALLKEWDIDGECAPPPESLPSDDNRKGVPPNKPDDTTGGAPERGIDMDVLIKKSPTFGYFVENVF
jgi:hypothetical protein